MKKISLILFSAIYFCFLLAAIPAQAVNYNTTLSLTLNPTSVPSGSTEPIAMTAKLTRTSGGAAISNAGITFLVDGGQVGGPILTNSSGQAIFSYNPSNLSVGAHTITANFAGMTIGSDTYNTSSGSKTLTVIAVATSLVLAPTSISLPSGSAGPVNFTATLTRTTGGAPVQGASIAFLVDGVQFDGTIKTDSNGQAVFSYNPSGLAVGSHTVKATFAVETIGNVTYSLSNSLNRTLTITAVPTSITSIPLIPATVGQGFAGPVVFTITLTSGGNPLSSAPINFYVDGIQVAGPISTGTDGAAVLNYNPSALAIGTHAVKATFPQSSIGGITYGTSSSTKNLIVNAMITTTTEIMVSNPNIVPLNGSFTVAVKEKNNLTSSYIAGLPVNLTITGPAPLSTEKFTGMVNTVANSGAVFSISTAQMPPGVYTVSASFAGTPTCAPSVSSVSTLLLRRMAVFEVDQAKLDFKKKAGKDKVRVQGRFELALGGTNGVSLDDDVIVTVGPLTYTIKMTPKDNGEKWAYESPKGIKSGIEKMTINWKNGEFDIRIDGVDLSAATNPVPVVIQIGYEYGGQNLRMREKGNHWDYHQVLLGTLVAAADLHLSRQGTYQNGDPTGASYGLPAVPSIANSWEWVIGSGKTYWNMPSISAVGLLAAYERTGDSDYLDGALLTGGTLVEKFNILMADGPQWEDRPFSQDIEFLARLSADSGDPLYAAIARQWYGIVISNKSATETADRYLYNPDGSLRRKSIAGWDLASQIRAAVAVGQIEYARGIAARLIERRTDWENLPLGTSNYTNISYASLLWALRVLADDSFNNYVSEIREALLGSQGSDGSWDDGSYQTTAYAILGLGLPRTTASDQAIDDAWSFLRDTQTAAGGWGYPTEYGEGNSEILMALGTLKGDGGGKKMVHVDPKLRKSKVEPAH